MSEREEVPICLCEQYWPGQGHHPECPVSREIVRLRSQLAAADHELKIAKICNDSQAEHINTLTLAKQTAERERDEARRALAVLAPMFDLATKEGEGMMAVGLELMRLNKELTEEREAVASFIAQNRALRARAERAERRVRDLEVAVREWWDHDNDAKLWTDVFAADSLDDVALRLRALDAAEGGE